MADNDIGMILDVTPGDHEGFERRLLEGMGHHVEVCHGPGVGDHTHCPLLEEGTCELVDKAHGVVFKLDLDREYHRRILQTYKQTLPADMPIAVAVPTWPGRCLPRAARRAVRVEPHADRRRARWLRLTRRGL